MNALLAALLALIVTSAPAPSDELQALCDTDSDCARFCPPPADDPDCDGGPEGD